MTMTMRMPGPVSNSSSYNGITDESIAGPAEATDEREREASKADELIGVEIGAGVADSNCAVR